jgi:hypothetical protein
MDSSSRRLNKEKRAGGGNQAERLNPSKEAVMIDLILEIELCVGDRRGAKTDRSK